MRKIRFVALALVITLVIPLMGAEGGCQAGDRNGDAKTITFSVSGFGKASVAWIDEFNIWHTNPDVELPWVQVIKFPVDRSTFTLTSRRTPGDKIASLLKCRVTDVGGKVLAHDEAGGVDAQVRCLGVM